MLSDITYAIIVYNQFIGSLIVNMSKILLISTVLALFITGCSVLPKAAGKSQNTGSNASDASSSTLQAKYYKAGNPGFKSVYDEISDFWFDIPEQWKAVSRSADDGGYSIITDDSAVSIEVRGVVKTGTDDEFYAKLSSGGGKIEDFSFNDGDSGKKIVKDGSEVYFVLSDGGGFIYLHADYRKDQGWYDGNADILNAVAMSIRITREDSGTTNDSGKITLDDLKLGKIAVDMTFGDASKLIVSKEQKEEDDQSGGKTYFYEDGTEIYVMDGSVYSMNVISSEYATPRGLKVGDSAARVTKLYGKPDNITDKTNWGYNYNGYELFTVVIKNDKVAEMQIDITVM